MVEQLNWIVKVVLIYTYFACSFVPALMISLVYSSLSLSLDSYTPLWLGLIMPSCFRVCTEIATFINKAVYSSCLHGSCDWSHPFNRFLPSLKRLQTVKNQFTGSFFQFPRSHSWRHKTSYLQRSCLPSLDPSPSGFMDSVILLISSSLAA